MAAYTQFGCGYPTANRFLGAGGGGPSGQGPLTLLTAATTHTHAHASAALSSSSPLARITPHPSASLSPTTESGSLHECIGGGGGSSVASGSTSSSRSGNGADSVAGTLTPDGCSQPLHGADSRPPSAVAYATALPPSGAHNHHGDPELLAASLRPPPPSIASAAAAAAAAAASICCDNGRPLMVDPLTGHSVCSCCPYDAAAAYTRVGMGVYGAPYAPNEQHSYSGIGVDGAAAAGAPFYTSLGNPYALKDSGGGSGSAAGPSGPDMSTWASSASLQPTAGYYTYDPAFGAYGYGAGYDLAARRKNATRESTATLKAWLNEHKKNPYPTKGEKIMLAIITKMTLTQVSTWFANARRRLKKENKMTWEPKNRNDDDDEEDNVSGGGGGAAMAASDDEKDRCDEKRSLGRLMGPADVVAPLSAAPGANTNNNNITSNGSTHTPSHAAAAGHRVNEAPQSQPLPARLNTLQSSAAAGLRAHPAAAPPMPTSHRTHLNESPVVAAGHGLGMGSTPATGALTAVGGVGAQSKDPFGYYQLYAKDDARQQQQASLQDYSNMPLPPQHPQQQQQQQQQQQRPFSYAPPPLLDATSGAFGGENRPKIWSLADTAAELRVAGINGSGHAYANGYAQPSSLLQQQHQAPLQQQQPPPPSSTSIVAKISMQPAAPPSCPARPTVPPTQPAAYAAMGPTMAGGIGTCRLEGGWRGVGAAASAPPTKASSPHQNHQMSGYANGGGGGGGGGHHAQPHGGHRQHNLPRPLGHGPPSGHDVYYKQEYCT